MSVLDQGSDYKLEAFCASDDNLQLLSIISQEFLVYPSSVTALLHKTSHVIQYKGKCSLIRSIVEMADELGASVTCTGNGCTGCFGNIGN